MKKHGKRLRNRLLPAILLAALVLQACVPPGWYSVQAAGASGNSVIGGMLTDYRPHIVQSTNAESGFVHPGVGLTKELLDNVQAQVRAEQEPWKSYFEDMLASGAASRTAGVRMGEGEAFASQGTNSKYKIDALNAYTQAILYYVTGDNVYRKNAIAIFRRYQTLDPGKYKYFTDACIHTGIPTNRMCIAAEIIRYSSYEVTDGYTEEELNWRSEEIEQFITNLVSPVVEVFQSSCDEFMNQHLYTTIGAMSGYLFMDDQNGYARTVEWFTVNKNAKNQGFNGSIKQLFREITTVDKVGDPVGSGEKLDTPVIQHVEMGRDQAHGCGDLTNSAILARLMLGQGTKVDPVSGEISTASDAVDVYKFLDDRILKAADFFFRYMLGYDVEWVSVPMSISEDGKVIDTYDAFAGGYRGRYQTMNFWDLYHYYTYMDPEHLDLETVAPYFYEGFMKKMPSNFYWKGGLGINWDNGDGGGDFWLFIPSAGAGDPKLLGAKQVDYKVEVEDRGAVVRNKEATEIRSEEGATYIRFNKSEEASRLSLASGGGGTKTVAFRIRTDGIAKLSMAYGVEGSIYLPNTQGAWEYVTFTRKDGEGFGDLYYVILSDIEGSYVDLDFIDIKPTESNTDRTIDIISFESGQEEYSVSTYVGADFQMQFGADHTGKGDIAYSGAGLPEGVSVDGADGTVAWTPTEGGTYSFYIVARANGTAALKKVTIQVLEDREAAIALTIKGFDEEAVYTSASRRQYEEALAAARAAIDRNVADDVFTEKLDALNRAVAGLELVSACLADGSLDFAKMMYGSAECNVKDSVGAWTDGDASSFVGYWIAGNHKDKADVLDFGPDFKVSATKFGFQARMGFSDRLAGAQVDGSNDLVNWTQLTVGEAPYQQGFSTVDAKAEVCSEKYRYLRVKKTTEYPDALRNEYKNMLEFGEFRIWGTRYEVDNKIESISMSCDAAVSRRIKMGDTVTLTIQTREEIGSLTARIQGVEATVKKAGDNVWTAEAVMQSGSRTGDVAIEVNYTRMDGTAGDTFYATTDGSSLFLVNSDIYIDTALMAEELSASNGSWDKKLTAEQCAALLFDKNVDTFGDLLNTTGDYYTVDFGEGVTVSLTEVMFYPRSTQANHASRLNGAIVYGSNDEGDWDAKNWTEITPAVTGAEMNQWTQIQETALKDHGAYRYFKIAGAEQGDIAEVEFYGTYNADPAKIAAKITAMDEQAASQAKLVYPAVPAGFTVSVKESSAPNIVDLDGNIHTPVEDTTVTLTLTVTAQNGSTADTAAIPVVIKGLGSLVTGISIPPRGASALTMPDVPEGFSVTVVTSSDESIVKTGNGEITTPATHALVDVTLQVTRESDGATVQSGPYTVLIYGKYDSQKVEISKETASVIASSDQWHQNNAAAGSYATKDEIGYWLFDGEYDTFGDLMNSPGYYNIDLGEGASVLPTRFRFYPRPGGKNNTQFVARLNTVWVQGSNDGNNWTDLTVPLSGITDRLDWYEISAEDFVNYGDYRYFRLSYTKDGGNVAEFEIYGAIRGMEALRSFQMDGITFKRQAGTDTFSAEMGEALFNKSEKKPVFTLLNGSTLLQGDIELESSVSPITFAGEGTGNGAKRTAVLTARSADGSEKDYTIEITFNTVVLETPADLSWNGANAAFRAAQEEANIAGYEIALYRDGTLVDGTVKRLEKNDTGEQSVYFGHDMKEAGSYTFKVTAKAEESSEDFLDSETMESAGKSYQPAEIPKERLVASFDFEDLEDGTTAVTGAGAKAIVQGSAAGGESYDGGKAARISSGFWLNVTKEDGTPLLKGMKEITISYDNKWGESGNTGWTFYAAPNTNAQTGKYEKYFGVLDRAAGLMAERYFLNNQGRPANPNVGSVPSGWKHVDIVITKADTSIYIDGELKATQASSVQLTDILTSEGGILQIGKANWGGGEYYNGLIDNFEIYSNDAPGVVEVPNAKALIEDLFQAEGENAVTAAQKEAETIEAARVKVQGLIDALDLDGVIAEVKDAVENAFTEAVAGDGEKPAGTNGSYHFTVHLSMGEEAADTEQLTMAIIAEAYPEDAIAIDAAKAAIEAAFTGENALTLSQKEAGTAADAKQAVLDVIEGLELGGVTAEISGETYTEAAAGTAEAPDGTNGSYVFTVELKKGEMSGITAELQVVITAEEYKPEPTAEPTTKPTAEPTAKPTAEPTTKPTAEPTAKPTAEPTTKPTAEPTAEPTEKPTAEPTTKPTAEPTEKPTAEPTAKPTAEPTTKPTAEPTTKPTAKPTAEPTAEPTSKPTTKPTAEPTEKPTAEPTSKPTTKPTAEPTAEPTAKPTIEPTAEPTVKPTTEPTVEPTTAPTEAPNPTEEPNPTEAPNPTEEPTEAPNPTEEPTPTEAPNPTEEPNPTEAPNPTEEPNPTEAPNPTEEPTPTEAPNPTEEPTPTEAPNPTEEPTPTEAPNPTEEPTPTEAPNPTEEPTPTEAPNPTEEPTPTEAPNPTEEPTPTEAPNPTEKPTPTEAPNPTEEPNPTEAPNPTEEPNPTEAPNPTEEPTPGDTGEQMKQQLQDVLEAVRDVNAASSPEEKAEAAARLADTVKEVFTQAADKAENAGELLKNKALDTMRQIEEKISDLTGRKVEVVQEQGTAAVVEVVNKEVNVPQEMDGEIRVKKTGLPSGLGAGTAAAYEFGLYYGPKDVPSAEWQEHASFDVPMLITLKFTDEIDGNKPVKVYHFADGSSRGEEVYSELTEDRTGVTFVADGFSTYVVLNETGETEEPGSGNSGNSGGNGGNNGTSAPAGGEATSPRTYDNSVDYPAEKGAGNPVPVAVAAMTALAALLAFGAWYLKRKWDGNQK